MLNLLSHKDTRVLFQYIWEYWGTFEDYKKFGEKKNRRKKIMGMKIMGKSYDRWCSYLVNGRQSRTKHLKIWWTHEKVIFTTTKYMLKYFLETVSFCESYSNSLKNQFFKHALKKYFHTNEKLKQIPKFVSKLQSWTHWISTFPRYPLLSPGHRT